MAKNLDYCFYIGLLLIFISSSLSAQKPLGKATGYQANPAYKYMMYDNTINFYTVCDSAEAYFKRIDTSVKGSGYKQFLRWKEENEIKYAPSGNRMIDHYLPHKEYTRILNEQSQSGQWQYLQTGGWQSLGPDTIGVITGHYAAGLGRVEFVVVNPANPQQIYMGSRSGGLWRTSNGGANWMQNTDYLPASGVNAIAASPAHFDSVLINVRMAGNGYSFGIYRSTNGGSTFTQTAFNPTNLGFGGLGSDFRVNVIKYHPTVPNLVFVGTNKGIFRSADNLATWVRTNNSWEVRDIEFHPTNPNIVYLYENYYWGSNKNRIHKSTNQGVTFTALTDLPGNDDAQINISVTPICPECIYATSDNGIWKSTNAGSSFTTIVSPAPADVSLWYGVPNDLDTSKMVAGYVDLFRSTNGGASFVQATWWSLGSSQHGGTNNQTAYNNSSVYVHADCNYLTCVNGVYYACTDGFLCKSSDNGATWQKISLTTGIRENYNLGVSQSNNAQTICGSQDNGTSIYTNNGWIEYTGADGMEGIIHPLNPNWLIGSWQNGSRRRSYDGGLTNNGCTPPGQEGNWIAPMFYDPNNHHTIYSLGTMVHKSSDFGNTWENLGTPASFGGGTIQFATIAENNSQIIVATRQDKIELSTNGGATFTSIKNNLPSFDISDVVFDPNNDATILVTYANYQNNGQKVFISHNSGANWQNITANLGNMPIRCAIIDHTPDANIYLGAENGLYKKAMNSANWELYNPNLPNVTIRELDIQHGTNTLRAATWGRGLWQYPLAGRHQHPQITQTTITSGVDYNQPRTTIDQFVTATIQYSGTLSGVYVKWSANAPTFTNTIPMTQTSGNMWQTTQPFPHFPANTNMYFKVYAIGENADTTQTYKFMYTVRPHEYCPASGESDNGNLYISNFTCAGISNSGTLNNAYTYYPNTVFTLYKDSTYTATANFNTGWSSNDFIVWIDYNNDLEFSPNERVILDINTGSVGSGSFTVPATASEQAPLRMRVRLGYWGNYSTACGTTLGEVEDYPVVIRSAPTIQFQGNNAFCMGDMVNFTYSGTAADSIRWTLSSGGSSNNYFFSGFTLSVGSLPAATYSVSITAYKYGLPFHKNYPAYFVIHALPTANAGSDQAVCAGTGVTLNGTGSGSLVWSGGVQNNVPFVPDNTTDYQLTVTDANNCIQTDWVNISVLPLPDVGITPAVATISCSAPTVLLSATGTTGNYLWSNGSAGSALTAAEATTYTLTVTDAGGCSAMATAVVQTTPTIGLQCKAILGGAYNSAQDIMHNTLRQQNLLPAAPPYNQAPWYLPCANSQTVSLPPDAVDYVAIEVRHANQPTEQVAVLCGLLHQDGSISGVNTGDCARGVIETPTLQPGDWYYFIIRHRNHKAIATALPIQYTANAIIDFRLEVTIAGGANQLMPLSNSSWGAMIPADINADGIHDLADFNLFFTQLPLPIGYHAADANLDGEVNISDFNLYQLYRTHIGVSAIRY